MGKAYILFFYLSLLIAKGQQNIDTIFVSTDKVSLVNFPSKIISYEKSLPIDDKVEIIFKDNDIFLQCLTTKVPPTKITVKTEEKDVFSFIMAYKKAPPRLSYFYNKHQRINKPKKELEESDVLVAKNDPIIVKKEKPASKNTSIYISKAPSRESKIPIFDDPTIEIKTSKKVEKKQAKKLTPITKKEIQDKKTPAAKIKPLNEKQPDTKAITTNKRPTKKESYYTTETKDSVSANNKSKSTTTSVSMTSKGERDFFDIIARQSILEQRGYIIARNFINYRGFTCSLKGVYIFDGKLHFLVEYKNLLKDTVNLSSFNFYISSSREALQTDIEIYPTKILRRIKTLNGKETKRTAFVFDLINIDEEKLMKIETNISIQNKRISLPIMSQTIKDARNIK